MTDEKSDQTKHTQRASTRGEADSRTRPQAPRRHVLKSMVAGGFGVAAGGFGVTAVVDGKPGPNQDIDTPDRETTPYTDGTYRALVDLVLPPTPGLAQEFGDEHEPGGLAVGLTPFVISFLDSQVTVPTPTQFEESAPLSTTLATLLDEAASELLARDENANGPDPQRFEGGGTFASLSREDRRRAVSLGEQREEVALLIRVAVVAPMFVYYSERTGYDDYDDSEGRTFDDPIQGWDQTDYDGRKKGHAVLLGYEVDSQTDTFDTPVEPTGPPTLPGQADGRTSNGGRHGNGSEGRENGRRQYDGRGNRGDSS